MKLLKPINLFFLTTAALSLYLPPAVAEPNVEYGDSSTREPRGVVYTMTNSPSGNQVLAFRRDRIGRLGKPTAFSTGGRGTGTAINNQNGLVINESASCLYAINPASDEISSFAIRPNSLELVTKIGSGGLFPVSIAVRDNLVYALNSGGLRGGTDNISGFTADRNCKLSPLPNSTRSLSAANTVPSQIQFTPNGKFLVVTEKATNKINTYRVFSNGTTSKPNVQNSAGIVPFGFAFGKRDQLLVSELGGFPPVPDGSSVSSYKISPTGQLQVISSAVPTTETGACWVVTSNDGRFIYVTNTFDESVSTFKVDFSGTISLLDPAAGGRNAVTGKGTTPIDLVLSVDNNNLYTLDNAKSSIINYFVSPATGRLVESQVITGLPVGSNGLATR